MLLIKKGLAYVCQLTPEEFKQNRGDIGIPAVSPYRDRPVEESLDLFARMRAGEFPNGAMTLRARIDLTSGNFNMRDPVIYRINHMSHHRQGNKWCIYPMYDFAHPIQDALEGITHSLCSLEFEAHRPLYNWVIDHCELPARPRQIEFARLGIDHTVMSKRKLRRLVEEHYVSGWDDPRMPTLCGLRRRGYTAAAIRSFCERIGVAKSPNVIEYGFLEHCLREDLNANAERTMAVLHPVKLTVTNYPEGKSETFTVENNPTDPAQGTHEITFSRHLWIEEDDFMEVPVPKYKRLTPGGFECRLKGAYLVKCTGCVKDESGRVTEVLCEYDPQSSGGDPADGRKVKGATLHWVDAANCIDAEVRLYSATDGTCRDIPVDTFITGPGQTLLRPGEYIEALRFSPPEASWRMAYEKVGRRNALAISRLSACCAARWEGQRLTGLRLALGAVFPTPRRLYAAEALLLREQPSPAAEMQAAELVTQAIVAAAGRRASASYKLAVAPELLLRTLRRTREEADQ